MRQLAYLLASGRVVYLLVDSLAVADEFSVYISERASYILFDRQVDVVARAFGAIDAVACVISLLL